MSLYPAIEPYATGLLPVSDGHTLFWERSGNPKGRSVLFLHGGPGSGSSPRHRRYYDPARWDIIQFDQRGCGRSTPQFSLKANTTAHLIADIEALRTHLGVDQWTVFGPSWGSTLALAYAQAHPDCVKSLVLEGVFLGTADEIKWWHAARGAGAIYPDAHATLMESVPEPYQDNPMDFIHWALGQMQDELSKGATLLDELQSDQPDLGVLRQSLIYRWSEYEEILSWMEISPASVLNGFQEKGRDWLISHSLIEAHYFAHGCFLETPLLDQAPTLEMPIHILQSQYDMVCPMKAAYKLNKAIPDASFQAMPLTGHAMTETAFFAITRYFQDISEPV